MQGEGRDIITLLVFPHYYDVLFLWWLLKMVVDEGWIRDESVPGLAHAFESREGFNAKQGQDFGDEITRNECRRGWWGGLTLIHYVENEAQTLPEAKKNKHRCFCSAMWPANFWAILLEFIFTDLKIELNKYLVVYIRYRRILYRSKKEDSF